MWEYDTVDASITFEIMENKNMKVLDVILNSVGSSVTCKEEMSKHFRFYDFLSLLHKELLKFLLDFGLLYT